MPSLKTHRGKNVEQSFLKYLMKLVQQMNHIAMLKGGEGTGGEGRIG